MLRALARPFRRGWLALLIVGLSFTTGWSGQAVPLRILFLGDNEGHKPAERFRLLQPVLAKRGIDLTYTDSLAVLNAGTLGKYDGLLIYANHTKITPDQEKALLDYVASGKGFIPIHCASYCFLNSPKYVELVGAQFLRHGAGTFRTTPAQPEHPILQGLKSFESWDETYVHTKHNDKDRVVLEHRIDKEGKEPWTWIRTHGKGRVFYTAWGHDERTWGHAGFHALIERGIRWAVGRDPAEVPAVSGSPKMTTLPKDLKPFEYAEAKIPFYAAGKQWGKQGEPIRKMQKPVEPAESMQHMITPVGFEVKLFAREPQFGGKPLCLNWDERGRLWVGVSVDYPNERQPEGKGRDKILILEDADGDGMADLVTEFADKLSIPTSIAFYRGGVIIHQAPDTLYLKDTDGDGVADVRKVLFTGWHTNDTHAGPSNLHYGHDNWFYGLVGYAGFDGTIGGERHSFRTGFYRFKMEDAAEEPRVAKFEFLRNTNNNSWGVGFSEEGILFGSTANGNPSVHLPIPNRYYEAVRGWSSSVLGGIAGNAPMHPITDKVRQVDWHGHFTAAAGHALYTARTYPQEYWNRAAFITEPTGHLVAAFQIQPDGGSFRSHNAWNLLASDDEWTSPVAAEVGPDGHVWVIDWYNFIVQHNPTPQGYKTGKGNAYETPLRDKQHGRIYRVVYTGAKPGKPTTLKDATPQQLVAALAHDNMFWRKHAQRLLVERGQPDVRRDLHALIQHPGVDKIGQNPGAVHALWTLHALRERGTRDPLDLPVLLEGLRHPAAGVRRAAVMVLPREDAAAVSLLLGLVTREPDPQVRLAALLTVAELPPSAEGANLVLAALAEEHNHTDPWLADALTSAAARHDSYFLSGLESRKLPAHSRVAGVVERVADHHARGGPAQTVGRLLGQVPAMDPLLCHALLAGLVRGWPRDLAARLDDAEERALVKLLPALPPEDRNQLVMLGMRLGSKGMAQYAGEITKSFLAQVRDEKAADKSRLAAAGQLIDFRKADVEIVKELLEMLTPRTAPEFARGLVVAAGRSESPAAAAVLLERLPALTPAVRPVVLQALLGRADWTGTLLDAIDKGTVLMADLSLEQKQALSGHPNKKLAARAKQLLARGGGLPSADREKVVAEWRHTAEKTGDAAKGKAVYKEHCAKCHVHGVEGTKIGPDLTGMAVHPKAELLVNILDPSRDVEGNYRQYLVATRDGRVLTGLLASESKTAVELIDTEGKKHSVQRDEIEELKATAKSLMPEGFEKQLKPDDVTDLLEFLTQRGKYLPLPLHKAATVVTTRGMFFTPESTVERLVFRDWTPKEFEGVPFHLVDPQGDRVPNALLLYGPNGTVAPKMPKSVTLPCNAPARTIHLLSGISGWGHPGGQRGSVSLIVRLHYEDGETESHDLKNGEHFADYIRRVDVPGSKFAYDLNGRQVRYLAIHPQRKDRIKHLELVKGADNSAPLVLAVTVESPE